MLAILPLAQAFLSAIDVGDALALLSRVAHTVCAAVLLGGSVYLRMVLAPAVVGDEGDEAAQAKLFAGRRKAWAACVGVAALVLLASGVYNYAVVAISYQSMPASYHGLIGLKMILAMVVIATSALMAGKTGGAENMRRKPVVGATLGMVAALTIFVAAAMARSFPHVPKVADDRHVVEETNETN